MTKTQRDQIEQRLMTERERAIKALRKLDESARSSTQDGDLTTYPLHLADEGTDTIEQEKGLLLMSQEGRRLAEIDDALRRLIRDPDAFGRCEGCGGAIAFERLDLVPWARLCRDCQERAELGVTDNGAGPTGGEDPADRG